MLRVLVDDVRRFDDDRPCITYRNIADALIGLREMAQAGTVVDELWLDHDLGGADTIRPVLSLLGELDHFGHRLNVGKAFIITSNPSGANGMRLALTQLCYDFERLYTLRGVLTAQRPVEDRDAPGHSTGEQP
jgi:hypothetical protein